jgi:hypothetical protein
MTKGGVVTILVCGGFVWWLAYRTIEDVLAARDERRARAYVAAEQAAEAAMAMQVPPPPPEPCQCDVCTAPVSEEMERFMRALQEWGEDLYPMATALSGLDVYYAEDWEPVG